MSEKPTYEELERRVRELEAVAAESSESNDHLAATLEAFPDILFEVDSTGRIYDYHAPKDDLLYVRPELFLNKTLGEVLPPNAASVIQQAISEALVKGKHCGATYMLDMPSGPNWYELSIAVKTKRNHHSDRLIALARNITGRKRAEEALKASEQKFRNIADNVPGLVLRYKLNPDGSDELLYISKGVADLFEVSPEDAVKNNQLLWNRIHRDDLAEYSASIRESAENLSLWDREHRIELPDGGVKWVHTRGVPGKEKDGSIIWDTLALDITDRKRTEEELKRKTHDLGERVKELNCLYGISKIVETPDLSFDETMQGIAGLIPSSWQYPEITCSRIILKDREYRTENFMETQWKQTGEVFLHNQHEGILEVCYLEERPEMDEGPFIKEERDLINAIAERLGHIIGRKKAEDALQESLAEKEALLREIHHRVKNNMQAISGLLRMHARRTDDAQLTEIFDDCRDRIGAMALIHEALYQSDNLAKINFKTYLDKLCRNLGQAHDFRRKGIALTTSAADISLDMDQGVAVGMIIAEMISNVYKHAFPDGRSGTVSVGMTLRDAKTVELTVADDGKGLPPDFDMSSSRSLGMRLVYGAVTRELGGTIEATNDGGATFIIRFKCEESTTKKLVTGENHV